MLALNLMTPSGGTELAKWGLMGPSACLCCSKRVSLSYLGQQFLWVFPRTLIPRLCSDLNLAKAL